MKTNQRGELKWYIPTVQIDHQWKVLVWNIEISLHIMTSDGATIIQCWWATMFNPRYPKIENLHTDTRLWMVKIFSEILVTFSNPALMRSFYTCWLIVLYIFVCFLFSISPCWWIGWRAKLTMRIYSQLIKVQQ